jgi:hypothetical protein
MAIVLPLGVVAKQLMRIEAELRLLNMKLMDVAKSPDNELHVGRMEDRISNIKEALDSIGNLED